MESNYVDCMQVHQTVSGDSQFPYAHLYSECLKCFIATSHVNIMHTDMTGCVYHTTGMGIITLSQRKMSCVMYIHAYMHGHTCRCNN